jgi:hypothetical protein
LTYSFLIGSSRKFIVAEAKIQDREETPGLGFDDGGIPKEQR